MTQPPPRSDTQGRAAYRLRGPVHWCELDGQWLVCAELTASISQLDAWSAAVLGLLEAGPNGATALRDALAEAVGAGDAEGVGGPTPPESIAQRLDEALRYLVQQDLVTLSA